MMSTGISDDRYFALANCQELATDAGLSPSDCVFFASAIPKSPSKNPHKAKEIPEKAQPFLEVYKSQ